MILVELSNPSSVSNKFKLVDIENEMRTYENKINGKKLVCTFFENDYLFSYGNTFDVNNVGSEEAITVFKTVLFDVKTYIIEKNINYFYFTAYAKDKSRTKLYNTLAKMAQKTGYVRVENKDGLEKYFDAESVEHYNKVFDNHIGTHTLYMFVKKGSSNIKMVISEY